MLAGDDKPEARGMDVTSPCDQRKFWKLLKKLFKNDVVQELVFTKYQPAKKHKGAERATPLSGRARNRTKTRV